MKCEGKTIVITGASRGLGKALAERFAAEGARLALCARNEEHLKELSASLSDKGVPVFWRACDIGDSVMVADFAGAVLSAFGTVDGVINNASILGARGPIIDYEPRTWDEVIQTNLHGTFFVTRAFLLPMMKRGSGFVINVSASVGRAGRKEWGAFAVSKFGIEGFTQLLAEEVKPFNIRVNAVNPGPLATDLRRQAYPQEDQSILRTPDQVTDVFVYLASQDGIGISGQSLDAPSFVSHPGMIS
jgi:NAD(P)-dependent dehydrogenase (short-subunit alcohol dehydrogenase family)